MAGGDGPISQTHGAAAEVPPAAHAQAQNVIGTAIQGSGTTNPDAPTASAGGASGNVGSSQTGGDSSTSAVPNLSSSSGGASSSSGSHAGNTTSRTGSGLSSSPLASSYLPGKNHISGGVPELPEGAKLLQSSDHWFIFEKGGKKWVRFYAPEARSPNTAKEGGVGDGGDTSAALLTPEKKESMLRTASIV